VSRVDDGSKPSLDGLIDRGVQSHGVTRASHLRVGQQLQRHALGIWHTIMAVTISDGEVIAGTKRGNVFRFPEAELVPVRDILHTYTESETP
jgi:hypothetical protein